MENIYAPLAHAALPVFDEDLERAARRARRTAGAHGHRYRFKRGRRAA
jgi:hypothetical protein